MRAAEEPAGLKSDSSENSIPAPGKDRIDLTSISLLLLSHSFQQDHHIHKHSGSTISDQIEILELLLPPYLHWKITAQSRDTHFFDLQKRPPKENKKCDSFFPLDFVSQLDSEKKIVIASSVQPNSKD